MQRLEPSQSNTQRFAPPPSGGVDRGSSRSATRRSTSTVWPGGWCVSATRRPTWLNDQTGGPDPIAWQSSTFLHAACFGISVLAPAALASKRCGCGRSCSCFASNNAAAGSSLIAANAARLGVQPAAVLEGDAMEELNHLPADLVAPTGY